jgi:hypothetical protein
VGGSVVTDMHSTMRVEVDVKSRGSGDWTKLHRPATPTA